MTTPANSWYNHHTELVCGNGKDWRHEVGKQCPSTLKNNGGGGKGGGGWEGESCWYPLSLVQECKLKTSGVMICHILKQAFANSFSQQIKTSSPLDTAFTMLTIPILLLTCSCGFKNRQRLWKPLWMYAAWSAVTNTQFHDYTGTASDKTPIIHFSVKAGHVWILFLKYS